MRALYTVCNAPLVPVAKEAIRDRLEPKTRKHYHRFFRCGECGKIYWEGSHVGRMRTIIDRAAARPWHEATGDDVAGG